MIQEVVSVDLPVHERLVIKKNRLEPENMTGKEKCELLKAIRKNIAEMNGIEYYPEQCDHEGTCPGFCPRCDMEASYLMKELRKKEAAGSPIRIDTESLAQFEA